MKIKLIFLKYSDKIEKTEEPGFTGPTSQWFNDEEFNKKLIVSGDKEEKDYYFNSYSTFYIHEEMIKDRVNNLNYYLYIKIIYFLSKIEIIFSIESLIFYRLELDLIEKPLKTIQMFLKERLFLILDVVLVFYPSSLQELEQNMYTVLSLLTLLIMLKKSLNKTIFLIKSQL